MARGVNKVLLIGNLGADPEVRSTPDGTQVANFTLATSESWKDKSGDKQERTEWHRIVLWRHLAEIAGKYLRKGSKVYLEGKLQTRTWEKDGTKMYTTEVICNELEMLDSKGSESYGEGAAQSPAYSTPSPHDAGDDDLPF